MAGLVWAKGVRNPRRFGFDRFSGHLYVGDVGDAQREELVRWRDAGRLSDRGLRELDRELDIEESRALT